MNAFAVQVYCRLSSICYRYTHTHTVCVCIQVPPFSSLCIGIVISVYFLYTEHARIIPIAIMPCCYSVAVYVLLSLSFVCSFKMHTTMCLSREHEPNSVVCFCCKLYSHIMCTRVVPVVNTHTQRASVSSTATHTLAKRTQ